MRVRARRHGKLPSIRSSGGRGGGGDGGGEAQTEALVWVLPNEGGVLFLGKVETWECMAGKEEF